MDEITQTISKHSHLYKSIVLGLGQLIEAGKNGTGVLGSVSLSLNYASLSSSLMRITIEWALADIKRYRSIGMHVTYPQGSLIPWQRLRVNWSKYDRGGSPEKVLQHFIKKNLSK